MKRIFWRACAGALVAWTLAACQTGVKAFDQVKPGMNKAEVLDAVGNPDRTRRWQGKDRWTYVYRRDGADDLRDVHFEEGRVVYAGLPPEPLISAAEQDRLNATLNAREDARVSKEIEADRKAGRRAPDGGRAETDPPPAPLPAD